MDRQELIARLTECLREDERVRGVWLTGSMARGTDDRFSDVDLLAVVLDEHFDAFVAGWLAQAEQIAPTVYRNALDFGATVVFNHVVENWLRFDVMVGSPDVLTGRARRTTRELFDRDDLGNTLTDEDVPVAASPETVAQVVPEFLRVLGLLPVALGRKDHVVAASGSTLLRTMLIQLMVESVETEDRGGALHLSTLLDPEHYRFLAELPPIEATRESAIAVHLACAEMFGSLGRELCRRTGVQWPEEFEAAVHEHLNRSLPELS